MTDFDYGVHVNNKFSMFVDDELDPSEIEQQLASQKDASKKKDEPKKKDVKKPAPTTNKTVPPATTDKKPTTAPLQKQQTPAGRTPTADFKGPGQKQSEGKENKFSKPVGGGQEGQRGGAQTGGPRRPPRGDRPPRQGERPPRFGGGGFTGGENQEGFGERQQNEDRGGRGGRGVTYFRGGGGRARGGGFGRGGFNDQSNRGFNDQQNQEPNDNSGFPVEASDNVQREEFGFGGEDRGYRGRGRGRGGGGFRGGRGGYYGGGAPPRGRQFDRISGSDKSGVKAQDKREGSGAFNWGTTGDQLEGENEGMNATAQSGDETQQTEGDEGKTGEDQGGDVQEKEEEAEKQFTLEEWRAKQTPKNNPSFNIRKPGEGESDKADWKKMKLKELKREKDEKKEVEEEEEEDEDAHHKKKQNQVPINFVFSDGGGFARSGRGRGGPRGGGRGRGGRGGGFGGAEGEESPRYRGEGGGRGFRGGGQREAPYKMDEESFPTLGAA